MAKHAINKEGAEALNQLANNLFINANNVVEANGRLEQITLSLYDGLGIYSDEIIGIIQRNRQTLNNNRDDIINLAQKVKKQAQDVENLVAMGLGEVGFGENNAPDGGVNSSNGNDSNLPKTYEYTAVSGQNIVECVNGLNFVQDVPVGASGFENAYNSEIMLQIADMQKYNKAPRVVNNIEFEKLAKKSGIVGYRTVGVSYEGDLKRYVNEFEYADNIQYNPSRYRAYGDGIYLATTSKNEAGFFDYDAMRIASEDSAGYGVYQMKMTFDENTRFIDNEDLNYEFSKLSYDERIRFLNNPNAYAASLGYDAIVNKNAGYGCDYTVVLNRTKLIVQEGCEEVC